MKSSPSYSELIALQVELRELEMANKVNNANLQAFLFANAHAKVNGKDRPHSEATIQWMEEKISAANGRIVEISLKLTE